MEALEERGQDYLFKLPMRPRVKELVQRLVGEGGWMAAGMGWESAEAALQLQGLDAGEAGAGGEVSSWAGSGHARRWRGNSRCAAVRGGGGAGAAALRVRGAGDLAARGGADAGAVVPGAGGHGERVGCRIEYATSPPVRPCAGDHVEKALGKSGRGVVDAET